MILGRVIALPIAVALLLAPARPDVPKPPPPMAAKNLEAATADRQQMLDQLGLTLPAQSPIAPAKDEADASPYPLPDPLVLKGGKKVTTPDMWWKMRRPEIALDFANEMYGVIPGATPKVTWSSTPIPPTDAGLSPTAWNIVGKVDNSAYPVAIPQIELTLFLPPGATGPAPVLVIVSGSSAASTGKPPGAAAAILAKGWACAVYNTQSVQADNGAGLRTGIIGLMNRGQPRQPNQWGALAAWSWGLSRTLDYLQTDSRIDAQRIGIEGHSRWGKTALLAAALDTRWVIVFTSCSGECGAKPSRRNWGETVDKICGVNEYHWMAGNFLQYAGRWDKLPADSDELIAMVAPRHLFIGCGTKDQWADPHGQFLAAVAASPVYRLLGAKGLETDTFPAPNAELISGDIGFRLHEGGHTDTLDWPTFLQFAQAKFATAP